MQSKANYEWHYEHFHEMALEYQYRRGRVHETFRKIGILLAQPPKNIPDGSYRVCTTMSHYPDCIVEGDAVKAYRNYYHMAKPFAKWE